MEIAIVDLRGRRDETFARLLVVSRAILDHSSFLLDGYCQSPVQGSFPRTQQGSQPLGHDSALSLDERDLVVGPSECLRAKFSASVE